MTEATDMMGIKPLWSAARDNPAVMRRVNGWLTIFWVVMIPVSLATHWVASVTYVSALSLWALVSGHWSAWQAARVEVRQEQEVLERQQDDVPGKVVRKILSETTLEPAE